MLKITCRFAAVTLFACLSLFSCTRSGSGKAFQTKEDSVNFAKSVAAKYRTEVCGIKNPPPDTNKTGVVPIPIDTVKAYQAYYDKDPKLFDPLKVAYKGFSVDPEGYSLITSDSRIKGLYLRLGRRSDGSYTIMLLGTDEKGNLINSVSTTQRTVEGDEDTNFDHLQPCPADCPDNDD